MAGGFDSLGLMAELVRSVDEQGWILPSDVQDEAIPLILGGGDVMVASETGSGKTAAFGLPMIQCVHERLRQSLDYKAGKGKGKGKAKSNSEYIVE
jgi:ATP-dependent RNA helicase DDX1